MQAAPLPFGTFTFFRVLEPQGHCLTNLEPNIDGLTLVPQAMLLLVASL